LGLLIIFAALLLVYAPSAAKGIKEGLIVSAGVLIPSLFPFMVLCRLVSLTGMDKILSLPLGWITEKLYKLPRHMGALILLSMVGGFPVGAKMLSEQIVSGKTDAKTAERVLCFCVNAGPPFLLTAVGIGMFLSKEAGIILLAAQISATVVTGIIFSLKAEMPKQSKTEKKSAVGAASAFVLAVTSSATAVIALCAFVVFFSGLLAVMSEINIIPFLSQISGADKAVVKAIVFGFFEVTSGCLAAAQLGGTAGFMLASAIISFSGLSVIFQTAYFFRDYSVSMKPFFLSKIVHMPVSVIISGLLYNKFCEHQKAWINVVPDMPVPEIFVNNETIVVSICLIAMCTILIFSTVGSKAVDTKVKMQDNQKKKCFFKKK